MKWIALLLAFVVGGCSGCASVPSHDTLKDLTLRLEFTDGICSGTKIGPSTLETAKHCMAGGPLVKVNGEPVQVLSTKETGRDRIEATLSGVSWKVWAKRGRALKQGDRVRWWGNPQGEPDTYREGYVSRVRDDAILIDATICHGDSGSGLFNERGELVGVVSAMTDGFGCTFMVEIRG